MRDLLTLDAPTDSALLWALLRRRLRAGEEPGAAVAGVVTAVAAGVDADHALVASEPIDPEMVEHNAPWTEVPDRYLVVARPGHHTMHPLLKTTGVR